MDFSQLTQLLEEYQQLQKEEPIYAPTMFELAGHPHFENVASNILAFFLDPEQPHGLENLFLSSLLSTAGYKIQESDLYNAVVVREAVTESRNRIDLVVTTEKLVVGVENKLYAPLRNDLNHYNKYLQDQAAGRIVIPILLTLNPVGSANHLCGFHPITYEDYFNVLLRYLGPSLLTANNRYFSLLLDFINTINHLKGNSEMENSEFIQWFGAHQSDIDALVREVEEFRKELTNKARRLGAEIELKAFTTSQIEVEQWIYYAYRNGEKVTHIALVHDIKLPDRTIAIDTVIYPGKMEIQLFYRNGKTQDLEDWLKKHGFPQLPKQNGRVIYGEQYGYFDDQRVIEKLQELLNLLHDAILSV